MAQEPSKLPSIDVIKFSAVELPKFVEKSDKDWIYYGLKNDYPYYLLTLYNKSNKHRAVVDGKLKYIFGQGWTINPKGISLTQLAQYTALMQSVNESGEDVNEVTRKAMLDWLIFGGFAMEVIWNNAGTKIVSISHVPFKDVRKKKITEDSPKEGYYYTSEWYKLSQGGAKVINNQPQESEDFAEFEPFDPEKPSKSPQLFYYTSYSPDMGAYPLPEYIGKIAYVEIDIGISTFWNSLLKRGFTASHIITFMAGANPTDEQRRVVKEQLKNLFGGAFSEEAGGFVLEFANDKDHSATVNTLQPTDMDKQYDLLNKTTEQEILMGINPMLFGIKTEGQLGGRTEIIEANELFQNTYVQGKQKEFETAINWVFEMMGFAERLKLTTLEPIGYQFSEAIIEKFLPAEAIREMIANRMGIDLKKYVNPVQVNTPGTNFSLVRPFEIPTDVFEGLGEDADGYEELFSVALEDGKSLDEQETEIFTKFQSFAKKLDSNQLAILDLLKKDPTTTPDMISKVIKKDVPYVNNTIKTLTESGHITDSKVTSKGTREIGKSDVKTEDIFIKYRYAWSPLTDNSSGKSASRPFCKFLLDENKLYSRKDIDTLNAKIRSKQEYKDAYGDLEINVWEHRGGWYRAQGSTVSVPQCRHLWEGVVVRSK